MPNTGTPEHWQCAGVSDGVRELFRNIIFLAESPPEICGDFPKSDVRNGTSLISRCQLRANLHMQGEIFGVSAVYSGHSARIRHHIFAELLLTETLPRCAANYRDPMPNMGLLGISRCELGVLRTCAETYFRGTFFDWSSPEICGICGNSVRARCDLIRFLT